MRVRAFPFPGEVFDFIAHHELVFVVEQNRDAQLRALLINEGGIDPARLVKVLTTTARRSPPASSQAELAKARWARSM
jgi:2-oxoglutarate ferredoxin oxidoreductase subunit alpha